MKKNKYFILGLLVLLVLLVLLLLCNKPIEGATTQIKTPIFNQNGVWREPSLNFRGNDIGDAQGTRGTYASCKEDCQKTSGCMGIITDSLDGSSNSVHCLLKNNFSSPELSPDKFTSVYNGTSWGIPQVEFQGNDIQQYSNISLKDCKVKCQNGKEPCEGIVTDFKEGRGNCWLKSKFETPITKNNRYSYQYIWSTQ
jgi:hypothetical protein